MIQAKQYLIISHHFYREPSDQEAIQETAWNTGQDISSTFKGSLKENL